ncbi:MAG: hypothetical protein CMG57_09120 [Candidatus Marinimicrobia bacterium]|nr:hypothetical protein [Candidatus Neomarinimicrobiota bacterium]|tara:strand:- start:7702 stop:10545 length:2844 start_codon:yes stop_codon:yes gene_type:complete
MNILDNPEMKQLIVDFFLVWRDVNDTNKNITLDGQAERKNSFYEFIYWNLNEHSFLESLSKEEKSKSLRIASNKIFNEKDETIYGNYDLSARKSKDRNSWTPKEGVYYKDFETQLKKDGWDDKARSKLRENVDQILGFCGSENEAKFDVRGLLAADIQSGKTLTYCALILRAMDNGYRNFYILAGQTTTLRIQTQKRLEGFLGVNRANRSTFKSFNFLSSPDIDGSITKKDIEKGLLGGVDHHGIWSFCVSAKNSDTLSSYKLKTQKNPSDELEKVKTPTLIIDDEADYGSIDTSRNNEDTPTTINRKIREILNNFDRVTYLAVTATPYANIFTSASDDHEEYGKNIYPEDFVVALDPPPKYFGNKKIFDIRRTYAANEINANIEEHWLPVYKSIDRETMLKYIPDNIRQHRDHTLIYSNFPDPLYEALITFFISTAIKEIRLNEKDIHLDNEKLNSSMLVHITTDLGIHPQIRDDIKTKLTDTMRKLEINDDDTLSKFLDIYEKLKKESKEFMDKVKNDLAFSDLKKYEVYKFDEILDKTKEILDKCLRLDQDLFLPVINSSDDNSLGDESFDEYISNNQNPYKIFIGGTVLSRGLTIPNLITSYLTREARQGNKADTHGQMSRWLGYRPDYEDLVKVFTYDELISEYKSFTIGFEKVKEKIKIGIRRKQEPTKILREIEMLDLENPERNASYTNLQKSRYMDVVTNIPIKPSPWSPCRLYTKNKENLLRDFETLSDFTNSNKQFHKKISDNSSIFKNMSSDDIKSLFKKISNPTREGRNILPIPETITELIDKNKNSENIKWSVAIVGLKQKKNETHQFDGIENYFTLGKRSVHRLDPTSKNYYFGQILSETQNKEDFLLDFDDQTRKAFEKDDEESVGEQTLYRSERHADFRKKDENLIVFYPSYNTNAESKFLAWAIAAKDEFFIEGTPRAALINTSISQESE